MKVKFIVGLFLCVLLIGCNRITSQTQVPSASLGVSMQTEKNQYRPDVSMINVTWKNETDKKVLFGDEFTIQKLENKEWKPIGHGATFSTVGHVIDPYSDVTHSYNIRVYSNKLEKGTYRIITDFTIYNSNNDKHTMTASFIVDD